MITVNDYIECAIRASENSFEPDATKKAVAQYYKYNQWKKSPRWMNRLCFFVVQAIIMNSSSYSPLDDYSVKRALKELLLI